MQDLQEDSDPQKGNGHPHRSNSKQHSKNPFAVHFGDLQNQLRLRTQYSFNEKLSCQVGVDLNLQQQSIFPVATLQYEVHMSNTQRLYRASPTLHKLRCEIRCRSSQRTSTGASCKRATRVSRTRDLSCCKEKMQAAR